VVALAPPPLTSGNDISGALADEGGTIADEDATGVGACCGVGKSTLLVAGVMALAVGVGFEDGVGAPCAAAGVPAELDPLGPLALLLFGPCAFALACCELLLAPVLLLGTPAGARTGVFETAFEFFRVRVFSFFLPPFVVDVGALPPLPTLPPLAPAPPLAAFAFAPDAEPAPPASAFTFPPPFPPAALPILGVTGGTAPAAGDAAAPPGGPPIVRLLGMPRGEGLKMLCGGPIEPGGPFIEAVRVIVGRFERSPSGVGPERGTPPKGNPPAPALTGPFIPGIPPICCCGCCWWGSCMPAAAICCLR